MKLNVQIQLSDAQIKALAKEVAKHMTLPPAVPPAEPPALPTTEPKSLVRISIADFRGVSASDLPAKWEKRSDGIVWKGGNQYKTPGLGVISLEYYVPVAGWYDLETISQAADNPKRKDLNNDSWLRFVTARGQSKWSEWFKGFIVDKKGDWGYRLQADFHTGKDRIRVFLSEGKHTFELSGRSDGHLIKTLSLLLVDSEVPA